MQVLERLGDGAMQRASLSRQQPSRDRLLGECVAEAKLLSRLLTDQLSSDRLLHQLQQSCFVVPGDLQQEGKIEAPSRHGRQL